MSDPHADIVAAARLCPRDYPQTCELHDVHEIRVLSSMLLSAGFVSLSKAVFGGIAWSRRIADGCSLAYEEEDASNPGLSWNRVTVND